MSRYPYLLNRNGNYYFRVAIPISLRGNLGQRELVYSLRTRDESDAISKGLQLQSLAQDLFRDAALRPLGRQELEGRVNTVLPSKSVKPAVTSVTAPFPLLETTEKSVSEVYALYLLECQGDREKTLNQRKNVLELWQEVMGDEDIKALNKIKAREFKATLMCLPVNMKQRFKGKTLKEIDLKSVQIESRISVKTINNKLIWMSCFMNWAIQNGYYEASNPFTGLSLKANDDPSTRRASFSQDQLTQIFTSPIFTGCKSAKPHDRYDTGPEVIKDGLYWVPLIALYSGARLQEICQLYTSDLKLQGNIWSFDINDDGDDKLLKTASSKRRTPIHPKLIELGLLDYHKQQMDKGAKRLFPDLPMGNDKTYSSVFSKRFNFFLKRFGIKTDKTSFHSFRHTFIDAMRNTEVHREVREALVGHLDKRTAHDNYGSSIGLQRLYEGIVKLEYPSLGIPKN